MKKVLKASAGTGKTFRLSLEYISALLSGQNFSEIMVLTFTRKATAEARERVLEHLNVLEKDGKDSTVWQEAKKIYPNLKYRRNIIADYRKQILLNKDSIHIYTIDSFINKLFKELISPYIGIYNYEITASDDDKEVFEEVLYRLMQNENLFSHLEKILQIKVNRNHKKALDYIKNIIKNRWKFLLVDHAERNNYQTESFIEPFNKVLKVIKNVADQKDINLVELVVSKFKDDISDYLKIQDNNHNIQDLEDFIIKRKKKFLKKNKTFWNSRRVTGDDKNLAQKYYVEFQEILAGHIFNKEIKPLEQGIFDLADAIFNEYDSIKMRSKKFTYSDISNYTYKYLVSEGANLSENSLSEYWKKISGIKIKSLFIDEFQDTSVLQWKIIEQFLEPEKQFIAVGDAKQSIYQWRGGEKELFARLPKFINGSIEKLKTCYRSDKNVLQFINDMFSDLRSDWDYERIDPYPTAGDGYVEVIIGGDKVLIDESKEKDDFEKQKIIEQNEKVTINLSEKIAKKLKNDFSSYKNVAVLARKNSHLKEIADYLAEKNIPYVLHDSGNLLKNKAVEPLYFLLKYIWQKDYHSLLIFLRSDLIKLPHEDFKFMLKNKDKIHELLYESVRCDNDDLNIKKSKLLKNKDELINVLEWIVHLSRTKYTNLPYRLITESNSFRIWDDDKVAQKNLYKFYSIMQKRNSLSDLMKALEDSNDESLLEEEIIQDDNAVDLMTIHKAKGLSLHTVFYYWDLWPARGGFNDENLKFYINFSSNYKNVEEYLISTTKYKDVLNWLDYSFEDNIDQEKILEEINNLYVALTRAKHNLFIYIKASSQIKPGDKEAWKGKSDSYNFYENNLKKAFNLNTLSEFIPGVSKGGFVPPKYTKLEDELGLKQIGKYFKPATNNLECIDDTIPQNIDIELNLHRETERMMGLAIHYFLEHVYHGKEQELINAKNLTTSKYGNILGDNLLQNAIKRAEKFIKNNPKYFKNNWDVLNEYSPAKTENISKSSRIDRLLIDHKNKEILIVDYKTGITKEKSQLENYKEIIKKEAGLDYNIKAKFVEV